MKCELDHIVIGARTLAEGVAYVESALGVSASPGGKHTSVSTHNALMPLLRRRYVEIISIDPDAPPSPRTRWFGLDEPAVQKALATGPKLLAYVVRAQAIPNLSPPFPTLDPQPAQRGAFRWTFGFVADGLRPGGGALPYFIAWDASSAHPCDALPEPVFDLQVFQIATPQATAMQSATAGLDLADVQFVTAPQFELRASVTSPQRTVTFSSL
jgi:hypothetical protein